MAEQGWGSCYSLVKRKKETHSDFKELKGGGWNDRIEDMKSDWREKKDIWLNGIIKKI